MFFSFSICQNKYFPLVAILSSINGPQKNLAAYPASYGNYVNSCSDRSKAPLIVVRVQNEVRPASTAYSGISETQ